MIPYLLALFALGIIGLTGLHRERLPRSPDPRRDSPAGTVAFAFGIAGSFAAQLFLIAHAAATQVPFPLWFTLLPIVPLDDRAPYFGHAPIGSAVAAIALVQTVLLLGLARARDRCRNGRAANLAVIVVAAGMIAGALLTPAATSFDLYAYAGSSHVATPYAPAAIPFRGDLAVINRIYGTPIFPSPYGPAWLAIARSTAFLPTLTTQLVALRAIGALALIASAFALRRLRVPAGTIAAFVVNPALIAYFVLDGHNDLVAIAFVLWAIVAARRSSVAAALLGILAAGIKLPFAAIAALAFARRATARARWLGALAIASGSVVLYAFAAGGFAGAARRTTHLYAPAFLDPGANALHLAVAGLALAAIGAAVAVRAYSPTAAWPFTALGATFFGWYATWGLPYAVLESDWLLFYLLSLPPLSFLLSTTYAPDFAERWLTPVALSLAPLVAYVAIRRRRVKQRSS